MPSTPDSTNASPFARMIAPPKEPMTVAIRKVPSRLVSATSWPPTKPCQTLVTSAGMTIRAMPSLSPSPRAKIGSENVGSPAPTIPLTVPANKNATVTNVRVCQNSGSAVMNLSLGLLNGLPDSLRRRRHVQIGNPRLAQGI